MHKGRMYRRTNALFAMKWNLSFEIICKNRMSNIFGCRPEKISSNLANKIFVPIDKISLSENGDLINAERIGLKYPEE